MGKISKEGIVLTLIGIVDLFLTIYLVQYREASEGNPLMAYYLRHGIPAFIAAKFVLCAVPLFILEYARRQRPRLVTFCMRGVIAAYICSYGVGVSQMNDLRIQAETRNVDMAWINSPAPQYVQIQARRHAVISSTE